MLSENAFKEMPTLANRWSNFRFSSGIQVYFWMQRRYFNAEARSAQRVGREEHVEGVVGRDRRSWG